MAKRHLRVLPNDEGPERPPWQWVLIGGAAMVIVWSLFTVLGAAYLGAWGPFAALAVAAFLGGMMVGRFGGRAGPRHALYAGLLVAQLSSLVMLVMEIGLGLRAVWWLVTLAALLATAGAASLVGGVLGVRLRR